MNIINLPKLLTIDPTNNKLILFKWDNYSLEILKQVDLLNKNNERSLYANEIISEYKTYLINNNIEPTTNLSFIYSGSPRRVIFNISLSKILIE